MWSLPKPKLEDALADVDFVREKGFIDANDARHLQELVSLYDRQLGTVTTEQHDRISSQGANSIHSHYDDTKTDGSLEFIRHSLCSDVSRCPYCSIGEIATLDHYMPKSKYKALALCRLNLVPMCWVCNRSKSFNKPYRNFVHPYYPPTIGQGTFLKARIQLIDNRLKFSFYIDGGDITSQSLNLFRSHWDSMKLEERLDKACIEFLNNEVLVRYENLVVLQASICALINEKEKGYGRNDWRVAVLRAISDKLYGDESELFFNAMVNSISHRAIGIQY